MAELLDDIHPGEILLEDFMKPMGISARQLAADIDVSPSRISDLVNSPKFCQLGLCSRKRPEVALLA